jgi:hypothetical protein
MPDEYLPTPEQIRAECEAIRAEWTRKERAKRERERKRRSRVRIPLVRTGDLPAHVAHCLHQEP